MLNFAGRKTLMAIWTFACGIFLFIQGISASNNLGNLELVMTMLFLCAFEFAPGPVVWLYMGEIMNDKGLSMGALVNWTLTLCVGLFTPTLLDWSPAGTFYLFGVCNIISVVYILVFMRETKGLNDIEAKNLYRRDKIKTTRES